MKTTIVEDSKQTKADDSYPRLWRMYNTETVCLETKDMAIVIHAGKYFKVGESVRGESAHTFPSHIYERITSPITIKFEP